MNNIKYYKDNFIGKYVKIETTYDVVYPTDNDDDRFYEGIITNIHGNESEIVERAIEVEIFDTKRKELISYGITFSKSSADQLINSQKASERYGFYTKTIEIIK